MWFLLHFPAATIATLMTGTTAARIVWTHFDETQ
jgi:hypothetical protein